MQIENVWHFFWANIMKQGIQYFLKIFFLIIFSLIFTLNVSCGRIYFPVELDASSRSERSQKQKNPDISIVPMTTQTIKIANKQPYNDYIPIAIVEKVKVNISEKDLLNENFPSNNDPGPYLVGVGDVLTINFLASNGNSNPINLFVDSSGLINILQLGRIRAEANLSKLEDLIYKQFLQRDISLNFVLNISRFNSKKIIIDNGEGQVALFPYVYSFI